MQSFRVKFRSECENYYLNEKSGLVHTQTFDTIRYEGIVYFLQKNICAKALNDYQESSELLQLIKIFYSYQNVKNVAISSGLLSEISSHNLL